MNIAERQRPAPGELFLDHVAHYVADLDAAAAALQKLGFAPTPVSHHEVGGEPAGSANRCLMLEHGYIEILSPTLDTPNAQRLRAQMARYGGVHLACFGTPAAEAEHARLAAHGFEPEPLVALGRKVERNKELRFKVVYVPTSKMPEGRIQYCEHLTPRLLWTKKNLAHKNGVRGLAAVFIVADDPAAAAARWARFAGLLPRPGKGVVRLTTARGDVVLGTRETFSKFMDNVPGAPAIAGYSLIFRNVKAFAKKCEKVGLKAKSTRLGVSVALPPALGGNWLLADAATQEFLRPD